MEVKSGSKYERLRKIGIGSYGVVFKCINRQSGQVVAIKRYSENDSDPIIRKIAMREVRMLRQLKHPNLINLIEVFRRKRRLHLVFDYCELTVLDVIEKYSSNCPLNLIRKIIWQTVNGINYCHTHNCIHRDIKPENILINQSGVVKLCDFGFARSIKSSASPATNNNTTSVLPAEQFLSARDSRIPNNFNNGGTITTNGDRTDTESNTTSNSNREQESGTDRQAFTEYVATRWYRAPELLIGEIYYDIKIDIWAIGCVTAELMRGEPIWPGKTDLDQLFTIESSLGPLTQSQTHTLLSQGIYDQASIDRLLDQSANPNESIDKKLPTRVGHSGIDFVTACLQMDPARRPTSGELLGHEYIHSARMSQFVQKDHAPAAHRLPILGDRTVTLPSLSPTINRTNSQALMQLTSTQNQPPRPAQRFVVASSGSLNRKTLTHDSKTSSIPLAISKQRNVSQRSPIKQPKSINHKHRTTNSQPNLCDVVAPEPASVRQSKRNQSIKSNNVNSMSNFKPGVTSNSRQKENLDTAGLSDKSLLPVLKTRSREPSTQRTTGSRLDTRN